MYHVLLFRFDIYRAAFPWLQSGRSDRVKRAATEEGPPCIEVGFDGFACINEHKTCCTPRILSRALANAFSIQSQCDEGHPACRNCQKSKRECLGYDPIFKPQPGPAAIQPSTSSAPSMYHTPPAPYAPPPPQGYTTAAYGAPIFETENASSDVSQTNTIDPALEDGQQKDNGNGDPQSGPDQARKGEAASCWS